MNAATQAELFEPTGADVPRLVFHHQKQSDAYSRLACAAKTQGWDSVERFYRAAWQAELAEAECLAMLADFERLGGVV